MFFPTVILFSALATITSAASAVRFDLPASYVHSVQKKCLSMWIAKESHVTVSLTTTPSSGQKLSFEITDSINFQNKYGSRDDFSDSQLVFTPQESTDINFCFWNILDPGLTPSPSYYRQVGLEVQIGKTEEDYKKLAKAENLKPREALLKQLEERYGNIVDVMDMFKSRDFDKLATHESTKKRIANFGFMSVGILVFVGIWQIIYLRNYFKSKKLI
ncbi:vesicle coat component [Entomophthora muscae]|uniref:Vesicle coat component n=1 Tax=Entomophthora muscae TaxID=34485 RepID=A0ACC2TKA0_9FUNG|nr:vesicle coat component [Entomophthora muscae]